ncbi:cytochrome b/b6 domain-containing protein [Ottowia sp.]|uniref:cytochrome b/b6 domain-containing protein n=1 Tax=Ottowia sp. TaxID=1898956 RepID=UPI001D7ABBC5|nr:cytochrome b/b6 domain-containing protein [Ottowia sp.]MCP5258873.1 cytochrome b/b6 domain-containing protein [Burkholderiaceae bacterium]MCB2024151.1 cytochrome b/b6 domain-containing protein [Ottowia sp.]MCB2037223.1 cytochrome b/b6 domain-containing protein [Ottowia sp.]HPK32276.1 cytochrome b/b6 domain-containing protein [Ottowia sp.]HPR44628.1 cytochrome b/b6 domain-containing protein [Ottowia sp.]
MNTVRIWDLPTRLFHWLLAVSVIGLIVTAKVGGDAMNWHFRLGYVVFALLLFRLMWGFVGGRWSRFASFFPTPARLGRYLRGQARPEDHAGHNPLGAFSVLAMLLVLAAQVGTGLFSDDDIAFAGPLTGLVAGSTVRAASSYHKDVGQLLVIGLVALHLLAIAFYFFAKRKNLVRPMVTGDKTRAEVGGVTAATDGFRRRALALVLIALAAGVVTWVVKLGG